MNVTIKQVAQEANLSVAVSRVLNTKGQVSEETRRRLLIHKKNKHRRRHQILQTPIVIRKSCGASLKKTNNFSKSCASPLKAQNVSLKKIE